MFFLPCLNAIATAALKIHYRHYPPSVSAGGIRKSYPWTLLGISLPVARTRQPFIWFPSFEVWCHNGFCTLSYTPPRSRLAFELGALFVTLCLTFLFIGILFISYQRKTRPLGQWDAPSGKQPQPLARPRWSSNSYATPLPESVSPWGSIHASMTPSDTTVIEALHMTPPAWGKTHDLACQPGLIQESTSSVSGSGQHSTESEPGALELLNFPKELLGVPSVPTPDLVLDASYDEARVVREAVTKEKPMSPGRTLLGLALADITLQDRNMPAFSRGALLVPLPQVEVSTEIESETSSSKCNSGSLRSAKQDSTDHDSPPRLPATLAQEKIETPSECLLLPPASPMSRASELTSGPALDRPTDNLSERDRPIPKEPSIHVPSSKLAVEDPPRRNLELKVSSVVADIPPRAQYVHFTDPPRTSPEMPPHQAISRLPSSDTLASPSSSLTTLPMCTHAAAASSSYDYVLCEDCQTRLDHERMERAKRALEKIDRCFKMLESSMVVRTADPPVTLLDGQKHPAVVGIQEASRADSTTSL